MSASYSLASLLSDNKVCYICGTTFNLHKHHVFGGANRKRSDREGCWCYLCAPHHNMSDKGVHFDREADLKLKRECQTKWMEKNDKTVEDFIEAYGKSYI